MAHKRLPVSKHSFYPAVRCLIYLPAYIYSISNPIEPGRKMPVFDSVWICVNRRGNWLIREWMETAVVAEPSMGMLILCLRYGDMMLLLLARSRPNENGFPVLEMVLLCEICDWGKKLFNVDLRPTAAVGWMGIRIRLAGYRSWREWVFVLRICRESTSHREE